METDFRHQMEALRDTAGREGEHLKDAYHAIDRLHEFYADLDRTERAKADAVLIEWTRSDDENLRFDATVLIYEFKIKAASEALQTLAARLANSSAPGAPYEILKVQRILEHLGTTTI